MGLFFSKRKKISKVTENDKVVLQLKLERDNLKRYQLRIEANLEKERNLAKQLLAEGKKDRAKLLLRKKRYQEQLLQQTDGQLENLEKLTQDLEFAQIETQVVEGLKTGNTALKKINDTLNIEEIERILDETKEGIEKQNEINELLHGALSEEDEDAVEAELSALIDQETVHEKLPDVPSEEPVEDEKEKAKEKKKEKSKEPEAVLEAA